MSGVSGGTQGSRGSGGSAGDGGDSDSGDGGGDRGGGDRGPWQRHHHALVQPTKAFELKPVLIKRYGFVCCAYQHQGGRAMLPTAETVVSARLK